MEKDDKQAIEIITHYMYSNFFQVVISVDSGLHLPISVLSSEQELDKNIDDRVRSLDRIEPIAFSAFLNMITQTQNINYIIEQSCTELKNLEIYVKFRGLLFHRHNLLYLIGLKIINNTAGNLKITGSQTPTEGTRRYYESLLLVNEKYKFQKCKDPNLWISTLIRDHPQSYDPDYSLNFYQRWLKRYWYIYKFLLPELEEKDKKLINEGISLVVQHSGLLSLNEYFLVVAKLFNWFLYSPKHHPEKLGFNKGNLNSFYINAKNFSEEYNLIKFIKKMALGLEDMNAFITESLHKTKDKKIDKYFQVQIKFFEKPILEYSKDLYILLDFKFSIERICSGLIWSMLGFLGESVKIQNVKSSYGQLLEKYFHELLFKIFGKENIEIEMTPGHSDALIVLNNYILIFEFTTEYYQIYSLYNSDLDPFYKDLDKILFNGHTSEKKKEKGKLFKLNNYVNEKLETYQNAKIIPILVTEKNLGGGIPFFKLIDFDIESKIKENNLTALEDRSPLIICLDDLEFFWSASDSDKKNAIEEFIYFAQLWQENPDMHPQYLYNFGYYLNNKLQSYRTINREYDEFFNFPDFLNSMNNV